MVVVYSGRQDLPSKARTFSLIGPLLKRLALRLNKGFRSFNLIWITKSDFLLFSNAMVSSNESCWAQLVSVFFQGCWIDGDLQTVLLGGLKRQMSKACVIGFTYASSEVHFRSTESQTFYRSIMTADDSIKCRCAKSGMTGQVGGFQNPGVCPEAFPSFLPHPLPALLLAPFFRAVFDSRSSFFAPKPHGNACYAG